MAQGAGRTRFPSLSRQWASNGTGGGSTPTQARVGDRQAGARHPKKGNRPLFARKTVRYQFIEEHRHEYSIARMCRVLDVSVSGYYAWGKRLPSQHSRKDAELADQINRVFQANRRVYASPRVHAELQAQGIMCARKRVARLMREQQLCAKRRRHRTVTTKGDPEAQVAPNLLQRDFRAEQPNTKWVADTTSI